MNNFLEKKFFSSFIEGSYLTYSESAAKPLISPTTNQSLGNVAPANPEDIDRAIAVADHTFHDWKRVPAPLRGKILSKIAALMEEHKPLFAKIMVLEMGKTLREAEKEVDYAAGYFSWFAGEAERIYGYTIPAHVTNKELLIQYEPVGPCGIITPWNFPLAMIARKVAPALAAGCTIVAKPAPESPLSALLLAEICSEASLPPGVFNLVLGDEKIIGQKLLESPKIRKMSFTGSTKIGQHLYAQSAATLKKLTMELGGNAPLLVFNDADIKTAADGAFNAKFRNNGQSCVAANRLLIQEDIFPDFLAAFTEKVKNAKVGDPFHPETDITTILHPLSKERAHHHISDALDQGATLHYADKQYKLPAILLGVTEKMLVFKEESFAPLAPLILFKDFSEGIRLANASEFGLAAYLFTKNIETAQNAIQSLHYGIIGLNDGIPSTPQASFGGWKFSGFGREGGPTGIFEYLLEKYISNQW